MALVTVEGIYKDGKVELIEAPGGIAEGRRVLVTFLPSDGAASWHSGAETEVAWEALAETHEALRQRAFEDMERGIDLGGPPYPKREELYDRLRRFR